MRSNIHSFIIAGRGPFPIDMLRYDGAWPYSSEDVNAIQDSFDLSSGYKKWEVRLYTAQQGAPTSGRWNSFNCRVVREERF